VADAIPEIIWDRLRAFLAAQTTGRVVVKVTAGQVTAAEFQEIVRAP
jgi:hypothetical protein